VTTYSVDIPASLH